MFAAFRYTVEERSWHYICKEYLQFGKVIYDVLEVGGKLILSHLAAWVTTNGGVMRVTVTTVASAVRNATCGEHWGREGPPSLSLMFYLRFFAFFLLPRLSCSEASVCFTDPPLSSLWSLAIFAYLMAIMQTAGAGLGWAGLGCLQIYCKLNIQNTQPQSLGHTATHCTFLHYKNFSPGLKLRESCRSRSRSTEIRWFVM